MKYDERLFCAFDNPVPEDREFRLKENTEYLKVGALSRDEVRSEIGKDVRGGMADDLLVDSRLIPITSEPRETEEEQAEKFTKKVIENMRRILG